MNDVKARPILFSGPMVRAILDGRKSQTRRIVKHQTEHGGAIAINAKKGVITYAQKNPYTGARVQRYAVGCPYGKPGDRLWVRETWRSYDVDGTLEGAKKSLRYRADGGEALITWKPSIHMPRWASRIMLEVTGVRVERVQEATDEDIWAEGTPTKWPKGSVGAACDFRRLWNSINAKRGFGWDTNCWVWVIEFRRIL